MEHSPGRFCGKTTSASVVFCRCPVKLQTTAVVEAGAQNCGDAGLLMAEEMGYGEAVVVAVVDVVVVPSRAAIDASEKRCDMIRRDHIAAGAEKHEEFEANIQMRQQHLVIAVAASEGQIVSDHIVFQIENGAACRSGLEDVQLADAAGLDGDQ